MHPKLGGSREIPDFGYLPFKTSLILRAPRRTEETDGGQEGRRTVARSLEVPRRTMRMEGGQRPVRMEETNGGQKRVGDGSGGEGFGGPCRWSPECSFSCFECREEGEGGGSSRSSVRSKRSPSVYKGHNLIVPSVGTRQFTLVDVV